MSDIPSGALDAGESPGGQPAVPRHPAASRRTARRAQALHRGVRHQLPTRARAHPHHTGDRRRVRGVVRDLFQRVPGQLLAALVDAGIGGAARRTHRLGPGRRLPVQGDRRPHHGRRRAAVTSPDRTTRRRGPNSRSASTRSRTAAGSGSTSPPTPRSLSTAPAGTRRVPAPGRANIAVGIPTFNRPVGLRQRACRADVGSVGGRGDRCGDRVRPGHQEGRSTTPGSRPRPPPLGSRLSIHNQPNLGGSGGYSRVMYEALKNTDCEQILFMDDDIRIEPDSILRALALNRFAKAPTLDRWADAQPAGALAPARDGRGGRPRQLHVDQRAVHRVRPRLRQVPAGRRGGTRASCCTVASTSTTTAGGCA